MNYRIIPCLLIQDNYIVKTKQFKKPKYIGDPLNIVKIFNEKEVDEIVFLDITASKRRQKPNYNLIEKIASECFMPIAYGGGISSINEMKKLFRLGVEKIVLNSSLLPNMELISEASKIFGSQSIVASIDIKKTIFSRYYVWNHSNSKTTALNPIDFSRTLQEKGAGEIFINFVDKDGMQKGCDITYINQLVSSVTIPVIACGGVGKEKDICDVLQQTRVSAIAAGSFFIFQGPYNAVLISYPTQVARNKLR